MPSHLRSLERSNKELTAGQAKTPTSPPKPSPAATPRSTTPPGITIKPRNQSHDITAALATDWLDNDTFLTAFFNALSISFPAGEKFFIDSVRIFKDDVTDPVLLEQIAAFCGQEGFHRREHQRYNEALCAARGYDLEKLEMPIKKRINTVQTRFSAEMNLAGTVAIEHLTAVMAHQLLKNDSIMQNAHPVMAQLWRWHSAEEMEHKAVAFDVYQTIGGNLKTQHRAMRRATFFFGLEIFRCFCYMLKKEGVLFSLKTWRNGLKALLGKHGFLNGTKALYKEFFQPGFHPWQQDTTALLDNWSAQTAIHS
ncbi:MAG: metal-dependent hydrolase [Gammaproteobacteria bacterium]|nr:metal-dependent hydrolase [Gammaproteobacteria bacterium]